MAYLTRRLLDVPIALIAAIDANREWFKSRHGIEVEELDRDVPVCSPAVTTNAPITVKDVQVGTTFAGNPIVRARPDLHGFAAAPLRTHDGHAIGTICVFDARPRILTPIEVHDLEQLAAVVMREVGLRLASRRALFNT
jgi:GAF domain-containing protein